MNLGSQNKIKFILFFLSFIFYSNNLLPKNANGYAVTLGALDKITAKFSEFNINVEETGKFGTLKIQVFECQKRPPEEIPENFDKFRTTYLYNNYGPMFSSLSHFLGTSKINKTDIVLVAAMAWKASIIPQTVPNRPTKGAVDPTDARNDIFFSRRSISRSMVRFIIC